MVLDPTSAVNITWKPSVSSGSGAWSRMNTSCPRPASVRAVSSAAAATSGCTGEPETDPWASAIRSLGTGASQARS